MIFAFLIVFGLGYLFGYVKIMDYLGENHESIHKQIKEENKAWYNRALESFKTKTTQDKIEELEKQIESLKEE